MSSSRESDSSEEEVSASGSASLLTQLEALTLSISSKLGLETPKVLSDTTVDAVVEYIKSGKCKNVITMVGAGISTSAGIPDFRSPGSGLYHNLEKYDLPDPLAIFSLDYFHLNPKPFFELAKELYPGQFKPTKSHYFIKLLEDKGLLLRHFTQNIDTLDRVVGIDQEKLVEAHGTFHTGHCLECREEYTQEWMKESIFADDIPICPKCKGVVKPDIVFFGENLPSKFYKCLSTDFKKCDLLIIMGSSLTVQPFAHLIDRVSASCPRVLINRCRAGDMPFKGKQNTRNVLMLGDCDDQCQILADKLGWTDDLKSLMESREDTKEAESTKTVDSKI